MNVFRLFIILTGMLIQALPASAEVWRTYQNMNDVRDMAFDGDSIWMALGSGGVARWNKSSGMYSRYTNLNGLRDNTTNRVFRDRIGRIWIPNGKGVSLFDNGRWTFFGPDDGVTMDNVTSIAEDKNGIMWFGSAQQGVYRYNGNKWQQYAPEAQSYLSNIQAAATGGNGEAWFGRIGGVIHFDGESWSIVATQDSGLAHNAVYSIARDPMGALWAGTINGLSMFDGRTWKTIEGTATSEQINDLAFDSDGSVWAVTYNHIWKVENGKAAIIEYGGFSSAVVDSKGVKWFGSIRDGVLRLEGEKKTWFNTPENGPAINIINDLAVDRNDALWVGTSGGVSRFDGGVWEKVTSIGASAVSGDTMGNVWIGSEGYGLYKYQNGTWESIAKMGPYQIDSIRFLSVDSAGAVWMGTGGGAAVYDGAGWQLYSSTNTFSGTKVSRIMVGDDNRKWIASPGNVIYSFDDHFWRGHGTGSRHGIVSIAGDSQGVKWVPASDRLYTFDENAALYSQIARYPLSSLPTGFSAVHDVLIDSRDAKWFATQSNGIFCLEGQKWSHFSKSEGLPEDTVNRIVLDEQDTLWAGTSRGFSRHSGGRWESFRITDNCLGDNTVLSSAVDGDNGIWFGTASGVSRFHQGKWTNFTPADGLPEGQTSCLAVGGDGTVWAGHQGIAYNSGNSFYGGGISRYSEGKWETTHTNRNIDALTADASGTVWMASSEWGYPHPMTIAFYQNGQWNELPLTGDFSMKRCSSMAFDRNGAMWIGLLSVSSFHGSIVRYDGAAFTAQVNPNLKYLLSRGCGDDVWFISADGWLLTRYDGSKWKTFTPPFIIGENGQNSLKYSADDNFEFFRRRITAVTDQNGAVWISSRGGLARFDGFSSWKQYPETGDFSLLHAIETTAVDNSGNVWIGTPKGVASFAEAASVEEERAHPVPLDIVNAPNPFNPVTTLSFTLPTAGKTSLSVYDITGRRVRTLVDGDLPAGAHRTVWDGTEGNGLAAASGIYFARIVSGNYAATCKMLLMK